MKQTKQIEIGKIYELRGRFKKKYKFNYEKFPPYIFVISVNHFPSMFGTRSVVRYFGLGIGESPIQETIYEYTKEIYKELGIGNAKND